jgi:predicted nucleic acid-binding protein
MIVVDASVVVDLLIKPPAEVPHIKARLAHERVGHVPHLLDVEVAHALRRLLLLGRDARLARTTGHRARLEVV